MQDQSAEDTAGAVDALERRIADLRARLPKHSVPASMALELDALEDELERLRSEERTKPQGGKNAPGPRV